VPWTVGLAYGETSADHWQRRRRASKCCFWAGLLGLVCGLYLFLVDPVHRHVIGLLPSPKLNDRIFYFSALFFEKYSQIDLWWFDFRLRTLTSAPWLLAPRKHVSTPWPMAPRSWRGVGRGGDLAPMWTRPRRRRSWRLK